MRWPVGLSICIASLLTTSVCAQSTGPRGWSETGARQAEAIANQIAEREKREGKPPSCNGPLCTEIIVREDGGCLRVYKDGRSERC